MTVTFLMPYFQRTPWCIWLPSGKIQRCCIICGKLFITQAAWVRRGDAASYCSLKCYGQVKRFEMRGRSHAARCNRCQVPLTDKNWIPSLRDRTYICAPCFRIYQSALYHDKKTRMTPEQKMIFRIKQNEYNRIWAQRMKLEVMSYYCKGQPQCVCCGEKELEFLSFDHILGGGTRHVKNLGNKRIFMWLKKNNYPDGFQVLCMNCNFAKGKIGYCPHERKNAALLSKEPTVYLGLAP